MQVRATNWHFGRVPAIIVLVRTTTVPSAHRSRGRLRLLPSAPRRRSLSRSPRRRRQRHILDDAMTREHEWFQSEPLPSIDIWRDPDAVAFHRALHLRALQHEGAENRARMLEEISSDLFPRPHGDDGSSDTTTGSEDGASEKQRARARWDEVERRSRASRRTINFWYCDRVRNDLLLEILARLTQGDCRAEAATFHAGRLSFIHDATVYRFTVDDWSTCLATVLGAINRCLRDRGVVERLVVFECRTVMYLAPSEYESLDERFGMEHRVYHLEDPESPGAFGILISGGPRVIQLRKRRDVQRPALVPAPARRAYPELWLRQYVFAIEHDRVQAHTTSYLLRGRNDLHVGISTAHGCALQAIAARHEDLRSTRRWLPADINAAMTVETPRAPHLRSAFRLCYLTRTLAHEDELFGCLQNGGVLHVESKRESKETSSSLVLQVGLAARTTPPPMTSLRAEPWVRLGEVWFPLPEGYAPPSALSVTLQQQKRSIHVEIEVEENSSRTHEEIPTHYEIDNFSKFIDTTEALPDDEYEVDPVEEFATTWGTARLHVHRLLEERWTWDPEREYTVVILVRVSDGRGRWASFEVVEQVPHRSFEENVRELVREVREVIRSSRFVPRASVTLTSSDGGVSATGSPCAAH